ncbi:MAG TPA: hypothetical protein PKC88_15555, partial [Plasticicumulans sp.]|nr:hypothetical protein [Plasticicumulans sp.]
MRFALPALCARLFPLRIARKALRVLLRALRFTPPALRARLFPLRIARKALHVRLRALRLRVRNRVRDASGRAHVRFTRSAADRPAIR